MMNQSIRILLLSTALWGGVVRCVLAAQQPAGGPAEAPAAAATEPKFTLQKVALFESVEAAEQPVPAGPEFVVATGALSKLNLAELAKRLEGGRGRVIEKGLLGAMAQVVSVYVQQNDYPVVDIVIPQQNIREGIVRLVVLLGKFREIKTTGTKWFNETHLLNTLGVVPGETIRLSQLDRSIAWANNSNPFRQLKVQVEPVANTGQADVIIGVEERIPVRLVASYENTGNEVIGVDRYNAAITYANLWRREHQISYGFTTSGDLDVMKAHTLSYQAPLPWRHVVHASAAYVLVSPTFLDGFFTQKGESIVADLKYSIPFRKGRWEGEVTAGASYRQTNNNLEFLSIPEFTATTDSLAAVVGILGARQDMRGRWISALNLTYSPGTFNSRSRERNYFDSRLGAKPRFGHAHLLLQRNTILTDRLTSSLRAVGQLATGNLLPSEQFSVGGMATVRGYDERILSGDYGYTFSHELQQRLPPIPIGKRLGKLELSGVAFWETGRVLQKTPLGGQRKSDYLASVGVGLRAVIGHNFSGAIDYGRQLEEVEIPGAAHHRIHARVIIAF